MSSKKHVGKILLYASVITLLSLIGVSIPKACHDATLSESAQFDNALDNTMPSQKSDQELQINSNVGMEDDSDEEIYESFTGTPDMTVYYEGEIADNLNIVMSLSFYEKKLKEQFAINQQKRIDFRLLVRKKARLMEFKLL